MICLPDYFILPDPRQEVAEPVVGLCRLADGGKAGSSCR